MRELGKYSCRSSSLTDKSFEVGDSFRAEKPRVLSEGRFALRPRERVYDLHPDGERFAVATLSDTQTDAKHDHVTIIFNFFDELRRVARAR